MSEILESERTETLGIENTEANAPVSIDRTGPKTVFEVIAAPIEVSHMDTQLTGPTQNPTYLGGQFMGIDSDHVE